MSKISSFYENTTKVFSGVISHNGTNPNTTADTITFMLKINKDDADGSAVIDVDATGLGVGGIWTITLTDTVTAITPRLYYYELVWYLDSDAGVYVLDQSQLTVKEKYQDNV